MDWKKIAWFEGIEKHLRGALDDRAMKLVKSEVESGESTLFFVAGHGYFVTRIEGFSDGTKELVLVAWQGKNTEPLIDHLRSSCKKSGVQTMRFHTAIAENLASRFTKKMGFCRVETVYKMEV